jgi:hypothetical protein
MTDAPKLAVVAILSQVQNGIERPISYASRQMNNAEQNYSASEAEMCWVTWGASTAIYMARNSPCEPTMKL